MRIIGHSLDDFLANIDGEQVFHNTVYLSMGKEVLAPEGASLDTATSVLIGCTISCVLDFPDEDAQALLQAELACGIDRTPEPASTEGSDRFKALKEKLEAACGDRSLQIKPGVLDF